MFRHHAVAQHADAADLDLDRIAGLDALRQFVGAEPDHVAGRQRVGARDVADHLAGAEQHVAGREVVHGLAVEPDVVVMSRGSMPVAIHGPIGLKVSAFLPRRLVGSFFCQSRSVTSLPMVQPKMPAVASSGETLRHGLADDRDQFALVFEARAGVLRLDDILAGRDQRAVGAIADARPVVELRLLEAFDLGALDDVVAVVRADGIERRRHHRHQELDARRARYFDARALVRGKRIAVDRDDGIAFDDAVGGPPVLLETAPDHARSEASSASPPRAGRNRSARRRRRRA